MKHRAELWEKPTQARHPWKATARSVAAALLALLPALPEIAKQAGIETIPLVASVLAITAAVTRILAIPEVDRWMDRYLPGLSADDGYFENKDRERHEQK